MLFKDYDYDYYGYGDYRGGYSDPYYDEYYRYEDYYFDYPPPPPTRGRGRQPQPDPEEEWLLEASISSRGMRVGTQAGRGRGVVARGRAGGPPARGGAARGAQRPAVSAARGGGRGGARGGPRGKGSLPAPLVCGQIDRAQNSGPTTSTGTNNIIPLVTTYHPGLHKLNNLLKTCFHILQSSTTTQLVFKEPPKFPLPNVVRNALEYSSGVAAGVSSQRSCCEANVFHEVGRVGMGGKRKFDGGHQNQGETKRRYQSSWGNQPLAQQPLSNAYGLAGVNGGAGGYSSSGDQQWYQDTYPSWS
uniref:Uncharacterized protein n=1 Tax=Timema douglasi TaxID=61478 RepID=A0A7R8VGV6_TIMDO|nr:unnamed protein product [Timema douglasi]